MIVSHPEECEKILRFLQTKDLSGPLSLIDYLWSKFSDECYVAGFMLVDNELLEQFYKWLVNGDLIK